MSTEKENLIEFVKKLIDNVKNFKCEEIKSNYLNEIKEIVLNRLLFIDELIDLSKCKSIEDLEYVDNLYSDAARKADSLIDMYYNICNSVVRYDVSVLIEYREKLIRNRSLVYKKKEKMLSANDGLILSNKTALALEELLEEEKPNNEHISNSIICNIDGSIERYNSSTICGRDEIMDIYYITRS